MKRFRSGDKMTKNETKSIILRLVREIGRIKWGMVLVCVLSALTMAANIAAPKFLSDALDVLNAYNGTGDLVGQIKNTLILLIIIYTAYSVLSYVEMLASNKIVSMHFTAGLRMDMSTKIKYLRRVANGQQYPQHCRNAFNGHFATSDDYRYDFHDKLGVCADCYRVCAYFGRRVVRHRKEERTLFR